MKIENIEVKIRETIIEMAYSIYIKHMFTTVGCFKNAMLLQLPRFTFASSFPYSNCVILVVRSQFLSLCKTNKQTTLRAEASVWLFVCTQQALVSLLHGF